MEKQGLVVLFPAGKGEVPEGFVKLVRGGLAGSSFAPTLLPVLNGLPVEELDHRAERFRGESMEPVVYAGGGGLVGALCAGYAHVKSVYGDTPVVRLDTAEHPPEHIPELVARAIEIEGMVVGDLDFSAGGLRADSPDEFAHLDFFPALYAEMTRGRVAISCAHGFQAFASGEICGKVFAGALEILECVERDKGEPVKWGLDGAMPVAAAGLGVPLEVVKVLAESERDRPRKKIVDQSLSAVRILCAASKVFRF